VRAHEDDEDGVNWVNSIMETNGQSFQVFKGRPQAELEWIAGILRAAVGKRMAPSPNVQIVAVSGTTGECQVCGSVMDTRVVLCSKCRTPHHEECWSYTGTCSTYGCGEIRCQRGT
jgi:hypothetical protein